MYHPDTDHEGGWTIYRCPLDYPHHWVVRMWLVQEGNVYSYPVGVICESLDEAREHVSVGAICFPRDPEDDPVIYETWM